jgi:hypothetical protein
MFRLNWMKWQRSVGNGSVNLELRTGKKVCGRTEKNEKEYTEKEGMRETTLERIIRRSEDSSDSDSSDNDTNEL